MVLYKQAKINLRKGAVHPAEDFNLAYRTVGLLFTIGNMLIAGQVEVGGGTA